MGGPPPPSVTVPRPSARHRPLRPPRPGSSGTASASPATPGQGGEGGACSPQPSGTRNAFAWDPDGMNTRRSACRTPAPSSARNQQLIRVSNGARRGASRPREGGSGAARAGQTAATPTSRAPAWAMPPLSPAHSALSLPLSLSCCYSASQISQKICCRAWRPPHHVRSSQGVRVPELGSRGSEAAACRRPACCPRPRLRQRRTPAAGAGFFAVPGLGSE